ncbi:hypothetical protein Y032_0068g250 [Ancylostoma ceylanicum]|nr:hypothetical protein Y032_0068g250 [Ancylostoma ceylanicum]
MWLFPSNHPQTLAEKSRAMKQVEITDSKPRTLQQVSIDQSKTPIQVSLDQSKPQLQQVELKEEQRSSYLPFNLHLLPKLILDKGPTDNACNKTDGTTTTSGGSVKQKSLTEKTEETIATEEGVKRRKKKSRVKLRGRISNVKKKTREKCKVRRRKSRGSKHHSEMKTAKSRDSAEEHSISTTPVKARTPVSGTPNGANDSRVLVQKKISDIPEIDYGMEYTEYEVVDAPTSPAIVEILNRPGKKPRRKNKLSSEVPFDTEGSEYKTIDTYDSLADPQKDTTCTTATQIGTKLDLTKTVSFDAEEENNTKERRRHRKKKSKITGGKKKSSKNVQVEHNSNEIEARRISSTERIIELDDVSTGLVMIRYKHSYRLALREQRGGA